MVNPDGTPTDFFIRWAIQRQIDIEGGISAEQAAQLISDYVAEWSADRNIVAGVALDGGGPLSSDVTIDHADSAVAPDTYGDSTNVAQITVDQQGHITAVSEVPISGGGGSGAMVRIQEIVTSASQTSITFSSIPTTYRDLYVRFVGKGTQAALTVRLLMRFNGVSAAEYYWSEWVSNSAASAGTAGTGSNGLSTSVSIGAINAATALANSRSRCSASIADYNNATLFTAINSEGAYIAVATATNAAFNRLNASGQWNNVAAITSLTLLLSAGAFVDGSIATLYGIT